MQDAPPAPALALTHFAVPAGTVGSRHASKYQGSRILTATSLRDLGLAASSGRSDSAGKEEPASSDTRSEQTGLDSVRLSAVHPDEADSNAVCETTVVSSPKPTGVSGPAEDAPTVSDSTSPHPALAQVSISTTVGTEATSGAGALSMQDSQRLGVTGEAAVPGATAASPPAHNRFCPPHGAKAICGRRARMEDAYTAVPFLLEVPMPGSGLPLEVCGPSCILQSSSTRMTTPRVCKVCTANFALWQKSVTQSFSSVAARFCAVDAGAGHSLCLTICHNAHWLGSCIHTLCALKT